MLGAVGVLTYLKGLLVQLLGVAILLPLDINSSQLVQRASYTGVVGIQGCLSNLKRPLQRCYSLEKKIESVNMSAFLAEKDYSFRKKCILRLRIK